MYCFSYPTTTHPFTFTVAPQILPFDFGEDTVNSGELISVMCSIKEGDLPLKISWMHNNGRLRPEDGISVVGVNKKISTLSIESVGHEHAGKYTCIAKNSAGTARHSAYLKVNG